MSTFESLTIKEIVTQNYRAASVFERYSLDFCCKGGATISDACKEKHVDPAVIIDALHTLAEVPEESLHRFNQWSINLLVSYIVENHHAYVRQTIPSMLAHTQKVAAVHGKRHPEMIKAAENFAIVANEMMNHMHKEEKILFPYITALFDSLHDKTPVPHSPFGSVRNPIAMMEQEHESAGSIMYEIRNATNNYTIPADACTTYRVTLQELKEFEHDLHQHVHLENNILFPKAAEIEQKLIAKN